MCALADSRGADKDDAGSFPERHLGRKGTSVARHGYEGSEEYVQRDGIGG